jgi:hypothetical protein
VNIKDDEASDTEEEKDPVPITNKKQNKLHGLSPRANYTDRVTATCPVSITFPEIKAEPEVGYMCLCHSRPWGLLSL